MDLEQVIRERYSCRQFLSEPVPRLTIDRILDLAQQTPSWCNCQPWQVVLVTGEAVARFRDSLLAHAAAAPRSRFPVPSALRRPLPRGARSAGSALPRAGHGLENMEGAERQRWRTSAFRTGRPWR